MAATIVDHNDPHGLALCQLAHALGITMAPTGEELVIFAQAAADLRRCHEDLQQAFGQQEDRLAELELGHDRAYQQELEALNGRLSFRVHELEGKLSAAEVGRDGFAGEVDHLKSRVRDLEQLNERHKKAIAKHGEYHTRLQRALGAPATLSFESTVADVERQLRPKTATQVCLEQMAGEARAAASVSAYEWHRLCLEMQDALSPLVPQPPEGYGAAELAHAVAHAFRSMASEQKDAEPNRALRFRVWRQMGEDLAKTGMAVSNPEAVKEWETMGAGL